MAVHGLKRVLLVMLAIVMTVSAIPLHTAGANEATPFPPARVDLMPLASGVSAGLDHTCFLLRSGTVACQGAWQKGQGQGDHAGDVVQVSAGGEHTCLLRENRTVECHGSNEYGEAVSYWGGDAVKVTAGGDHTCILRLSGNVVCFGRTDKGQAAGFTGGDVVDVSAGAQHTCAVRASGSVDCIGANDKYQSIGYTGTGAVRVSAGDIHTCVLMVDGTVHCFGHNGYRQSDDYTAGDAVGVAAGGKHTCILRASGSVTCQGRNTYGQSHPYNGTDAVAVSAGYEHTCILLKGGQALCQGFNLRGQATDYPFPVEHERPQGWERTFLQSDAYVFRGVHEETPGAEHKVAYVKAGPRGYYYDVYVTAGGRLFHVGIPTLGLVGTSVDTAVVDLEPTVVDAEGVTVTVASYVDWDPSEPFCLLYLFRGCSVWSPFWPGNVAWARTEAEDATLTVGVRVHTDDGFLLHTNTVTVPYAGQPVATTAPWQLDR